MRRLNVGKVAALLCCIAGIVRADGRDRDGDRDDNTDVVTDTPPAATATMTKHKDDRGCPAFTVQGKVRKAYRGPGANVKLLCMSYNDLLNGGTPTVFPPAGNCDGNFCPGNNNVDAAGNFSFEINPGCEAPSQLDPTNFCVFVAHVDEKNRARTGGGGGDPNGSAPCSGGYCPPAP